MTIDKKREIIEEAFNYYHDRTALNNKEEKELLNFVNELYEAISVTHCCTELTLKDFHIGYRYEEYQFDSERYFNKGMIWVKKEYTLNSPRLNKIAKLLAEGKLRKC